MCNRYEHCFDLPVYQLEPNWMLTDQEKNSDN